MTGPHARARTTRRLRLIALVAVATLLLGAAPAGAATRAPLHYLALGDSLAVGIQPDAGGNNQPTDQGYTDNLAAVAGLLLPQLELTKLGCPGETTTSMRTGGICPYAGGSQLADAVAFLTAHRSSTVLVTLDIGANDLVGCLDRATGVIGEACVAAGFQAVAVNLPPILAALRAAAGPNVPILGMNYYDPFLGFWVNGPAGQALAQSSVGILASYNQLLGSIYAAAHVPVADVQAAFATANFDTQVNLSGFGRVPLNVALICRWTWMCAPPPQGPNIHARASGYRVLAGAFLVALLKPGVAARPGLIAGVRQHLAATPAGRAR
jgi:lysophospholipase L1-like esterase